MLPPLMTLPPILPLSGGKPSRKAPVYKTPESAVKAACMGWLALNKVFCWRNNTGSYKTSTGQYVAYGLKGSPDIIGMTQTGRFIGIECKSNTGSLSDDQKNFRDMVLRNDGIYIVARSIDALEERKADILK